MFRAIKTKYLGYSNTLSSRVKATIAVPEGIDARKQVTVNWNHELGENRNHLEAAKALASANGLYGVWVGGDIDVNGYVYVRIMGNDAGALGLEGVDWFHVTEGGEHGKA